MDEGDDLLPMSAGVLDSWRRAETALLTIDSRSVCPINEGGVSVDDVDSVFCLLVFRVVTEDAIVHVYQFVIFNF